MNQVSCVFECCLCAAGAAVYVGRFRSVPYEALFQGSSLGLDPSVCVTSRSERVVSSWAEGPWKSVSYFRRQLTNYSAAFLSAFTHPCEREFMTRTCSEQVDHNLVSYTSTPFICGTCGWQNIRMITFIRRFYPKRLTVHSGYACFVSMCVPWESNPQPLRF